MKNKKITRATKPYNANRTKTFSISIKPDLLKKLTTHCKSKKISRSSYVSSLLTLKD